jgi:hypothetical protein
VATVTYQGPRWGALSIAAVISAGVAAIWLLPIRPWASTIPGSLGDNVIFVWNTWWADHWIRAGGSPFYTPYLFSPWGTSLALDTHTILPSLVAAALPGPSVIAATNAVVWLHLTLNFLCAYLLARRVTRRAFPACVGGLVFGWSPYVAAHLAGHFNLIAAWILALFALLLLRVLEEDDRLGRILLGIVAGVIPYVDYYYAVYAIGIGVVVLAHRSLTFSRRQGPLNAWQRRLVAACATLLTIDLLVIAIVAIGGGSTIAIGGIAVSMRGIQNPMAAAGLLVMTAVAIALVPGMRAGIGRRTLAADVRRVAVPTLIAALLSIPLAAAVLSVWRSGGYISQTYLWRSSPAGVDAGTLILGNVRGALWPGAVAGAYERLHIDSIERIAWLGPGVIVLCLGAFRARDPRVRLWTAIGVVFGVWALGPRLEMFGRDLHVYLPAVLLRYVPVAANARMPGRAMVVVYLAAAMIAAAGADGLVARGRRGLAWMLAALVTLDFMPRWPTVYRPDHPAIYDMLARDSTPGSVCELPMGLRDGFGETGKLDTRVLYYQTIHQRPTTGGFVARLDPRLVQAYKDDPVLGVLLRLSGGGALGREQPLAPAQAADSLLAQGIRFVVINEETAPPDLLRYVSTELPLRGLGRDGARVLYEVANPSSVSSARPSR